MCHLYRRSARTAGTVIACLLLIGAAATGKLTRSDVSFYAPFENTLTADVAEGEATPLDDTQCRYTDGLIGQGVVTKGRITYPFEDNVNLKESTVSLWIRPIDWGSKDLKQGQYNFFKVHGSPAMQITHVYWGVVRFYMHHRGKKGATNVFKYHKFQPGRWYHLAATWKSGNEAQFFINGAPVGVITEKVVTVENGIHFSIGAPQTVFDELMIFNRALRPEEIRAMYYRGLPAPE